MAIFLVVLRRDVLVTLGTGAVRSCGSADGDDEC